MQNTIQNKARAIIIENGKVLLCHELGAEHYFLPGGHIEFGEYAEETLIREFEEEAGRDDLKIGPFITAVEHMFEYNESLYHEYNMLYEASVTNIKSIKSIEPHIELVVKDLSEVPNLDIRPEGIKKEITKLS